jgi:hypothetical protein
MQVTFSGALREAFLSALGHELCEANFWACWDGDLGVRKPDQLSSFLWEMYGKGLACGYIRLIMRCAPRCEMRFTVESAGLGVHSQCTAVWV